MKTGDLGHILHGGFRRYRSDKKFDGEGFCQGHGGYSIKDGNLMSSLALRLGFRIKGSPNPSLAWELA